MLLSNKVIIMFVFWYFLIKDCDCLPKYNYIYSNLSYFFLRFCNFTQLYALTWRQAINQALRLSAISNVRQILVLLGIDFKQKWRLVQQSLGAIMSLFIIVRWFFFSYSITVTLIALKSLFMYFNLVHTLYTTWNKYVDKYSKLYM